jgi:2-oxoisovalerate dehydrogenase E1 component alpha subunit
LFKQDYRPEASGTFNRSPEELRGSNAVTHAVDVRRLTPQVLTRRRDRVVRLLAEDGSRLTDPEWDVAAGAVTDAALLGMYEDMVVVRSLDTTATTLQRQGELALWPPLLGQEAAQVGSARMLAPGDFAFSSYREHAVAYCRGATPTELVRVWRGVAVSGWDPRAIGMAAPQVVVGAQALHATGWALGALWEGAAQAAIAYFGDGATSEGDVAEAMVFAASFRAPVVFFCQNNGWAISEPVALQTPVSIAGRAAGFGMPSVVVDGNDVLAVAAVTAQALERARSGGGPTFIEAVTYRMGPHTTADDPTRYREEAEVAAWRGRDPITRLRAHLEDVGVLDADQVRAVDERAGRVAAEMRAGCAGLADPEPLSVFDHVYVGDHPDLARQRARYARHLAAFADELA